MCLHHRTHWCLGGYLKEHALRFAVCMLEKFQRPRVVKANYSDLRRVIHVEIEPFGNRYDILLRHKVFDFHALCRVIVIVFVLVLGRSSSRSAEQTSGNSSGDFLMKCRREFSLGLAKILAPNSVAFLNLHRFGSFVPVLSNWL